MKRAKLMQALAAKEHKGKAEASKSTDIGHFAIFQQAGLSSSSNPSSIQATKKHLKNGGYLTKDTFAANPTVADLGVTSEAYDYDVQSENSNLEDWQLHALKPKLNKDTQRVCSKSSRSHASGSVSVSSVSRRKVEEEGGRQEGKHKDDVVWQETERIRKRCDELNEAVDDDEIEKLLKQTEARVCEGKSEEFVRAFKSEWSKQKSLIATSQSSAKRTFGQQVIAEKEREELAKKTWEYQIAKLDKKSVTLKEQLESVRDEMEEYDQAIKRLSADPDTVTTMEDLRQVLTVLLASSANVRKAKDKCILTELARRTDNLLCVACQENQKELVFKPCKHFALCTSCFKKLPQRICPICRTKIVKYSDVIIP